jgi:hypothetical protein
MPHRTASGDLALQYIKRLKERAGAAAGIPAVRRELVGVEKDRVEAVKIMVEVGRDCATG